VVWYLALPSSVICACAWTISSGVFLVDLLISQQIWLAWWAVLMAVLSLGLRRWRLAAVHAVLCLLAFYPIAWGRTLMLPEVDFTVKQGDVVRVVSCNVNPKSTQWESAVQDLLELNADVVVLLEVPPDLTRLIRRQGWVGNEEYKYWVHRAWVDDETSPGYILSRWPIELAEPLPDPASAQHVLRVMVEHPSGPFIAGLMHPFSPRDRERWSYGNGVIEAQAAHTELANTETGLPQVLGVDLNAGLAQARARTLRAAGLRPSKPLTRIGGTFPVDKSMPGILTLQIDDVWTMGSLSVEAWSSIKVIGSDHRAIVVDLAAERSN
jgi:endonuclease/exonuclease/phosphatase (EEP) superfamily protein YafD